VDDGRDGEPTQEPTPKRLEEARRSGDLPISHNAVATAALLGAFVAVMATAGAVFAGLAGLGRTAWGTGGGGPTAILRDAIWVWGRAIAPALLAAVALAVVVGLAQTRGLLAPGALRPRLRWRLPLTRWNAMRVIFLGLLAAVAVAFCLPSIIRNIATLPRPTAGRTLEAMGAMLGIVGGSLVAVAVAVAVADVVARRWSWRRRMQMTAREVARERRETEGDPWIAEERRRAHRERSGA